MQLFTLCTSCHYNTTGEVTYTKGTFIAVRQQCSHCGQQRVWTSQPHIKDTPAGNILLSASILYSGTTPAKILRVLTHMKIACFTDRTFYYHQKRYLGPAAISVWEAKQSMLLSQCKATGKALTIGGDGRADSPGHSAKYGSYGIIDLATNKVIHVELVQVASYYFKIQIFTSLQNRVMKYHLVIIWRWRAFPEPWNFWMQMHLKLEH